MTHRYVLLVFCVGSLAAFLSVAFSIYGLGPIDDHQFISTIFQGKNFHVCINPELGRFFPLTAQEYVLAAKIFEPSPHLLYVISGIKALFCGSLLLYCLILTRASNCAIAVLWGVVIFSIGFANSALKLNVGELNVLCLILFFIWSTLVSDKATPPLSIKHNIAAIGGLVAFTVALFYKELVFVFALAFGCAELLRYYRQNQARIPRRIWAPIIIGICYIVFYALWRALYTTGSYASFHSKTLWDIVQFYALNDPIIIFIVLPLTFFRAFLIIRDANRHTIFDSFLVAACAYTGAFLALRMSYTHYLLPAYGFAVCGLAGILVNQSSARLNTAVIVVAGLLGANTLPMAVSDMQYLRAIANNHYQFVHSISTWIRANPLPTAERRNIVLAGVSPGSGAEVMISLKTFLESLGVRGSSFEVCSTEPTDNKAISSFYGLKDESGYTPKIGDLLIFNPYQKIGLFPPLLSPSYREVYRSSSEWAVPRRAGWEWAKICLLSLPYCSSEISGSRLYTGYAAMLVTRKVAPVQLAPLIYPSYRVDYLSLPVRMRVGTARKLDVSIENTGQETWPANGTLSPGRFVHLSYIWINKKDKVALEGDRSAFLESIQPNDKTRVSIFLKTPKKPGKYKLVVSPVQEGVRWFYTNNGMDVAKEIDVF